MLPVEVNKVVQTTEPISAASGPKFALLCGYVEKISLLNKFFPIVDIGGALCCEDIARQNRAMLPLRRFFGDFCVLYFQRAACSTFQTCILNSH